MNGQWLYLGIYGSPLHRRLLRGAIAGCLLASSAALATDNTGVPALLQFAEQYNEQNLRQVTQALPEQQKLGSAKSEQRQPKAVKKPRVSTLGWQIKEVELQRQRITIAQLEQKVGALQTLLAEKNAQLVPAPLPDMKALSQLAQGLRQALAIPPLEQQILTALERGEQATRALKKRNGVLQTRLTSAQKDYQRLNTGNENLKQQLESAKDQSEQQRQQRQSLQNEKDNQLVAVASLRAELAALQAKIPVQMDNTVLEKPSVRQDYAAGVSLGEEILQMQADRKQWGVKTDKQTILAGIVDTFAGQRHLNDDQLNQALIASEALVRRARDKVMAEQAKTGENYLATFKKDPQVKRTTAGAWYRIDYEGDAPIPARASLDVVVKEMLTNDVVINDMEANGAVLTQTLDKFPPLFQEALKTLRNHGSLTLVVPPELAYGDKGYPPSVPPNATMVYRLRVAEMYPQEIIKKTSSSTNTRKISL
jgi:FKBP-type peptidyl-prolyl cis-trans isomerase FkpA